MNIKSSIFKILTLILFSINVSMVSSQESENGLAMQSNAFIPLFQKNKMYQITTKAGTKYIGVVVDEKSETVTLENKKADRKYEIIKSEIENSRQINAAKAHEILMYDDNFYANNYLISENALPFRKEGVNTTAHWLAIENINYSFNENWGVSVNTIVFLPVSIGVKCSFRLANNTYFGANAFVLGIVSNQGNGLNTPGFGGLGKITRGDYNNNFTIGGGYLFISGIKTTNNSSSNSAAAYFASAGFCNRFAKHASFNAETFYFPQINLNFTGVSIRWIRNENMSWNFGCYGIYLGSITSITDKSKVIPVPYISYSTHL